MKFPQIFRNNIFLRNTVILTSGTFLGQLIPIAFSPILSRIYSPEEFGIFGTLMTIATIMAAIGAFRLELRIVLEKSQQSILKLLKLCFVLVSALALLYLLITSFSSLFIGNYININDQLAHTLYYAVAIFFGLVLIQIIQQFLNSTRNYRLYSTSQIVKTSGSVISQILFGLIQLNVYGLILGNIISSFIALVFIFMKTKLIGLLTKIKLSSSDLHHIITKHKNFIRYSAPQDLLNSISRQFPIFFLGYFYGAETVGLYWFGVRIIQLPSAFVGKAIREVFYKEAADKQQNFTRLFNLFKKTTKTLIIAIIPAMIIMFPIAPRLFSIVFGNEWLEAGRMARWLFLWVGIAFCNIPTNQMFYILSRQKYLLIYELILTSSRLFVLTYGGNNWPVMTTIIVFSMVGFILNSTLIFYMYMYLRKIQHDKNIGLDH